MKRKTKGTTSTRTDAPPGFEGVLWPDDVEIDWSPSEPTTLAEDVARELVKSLPASMVQSVADLLAGGKSEMEAWSMQSKAPEWQNGAHTGIDWASVPLGKLDDAELASMLGVSIAAVCQRRQRAGIPSKKDTDWIAKWSAQPLGKVPDKEIAAALGVPKAQVAHARLRLGIPPVNPAKSHRTRDIKVKTASVRRRSKAALRDTSPAI